MTWHRALLAAAAFAALTACKAPADARGINAGERAASSELPFTATPVAEFDTPWAIALLPDSRMLVTEKPGGVFLVSRQGRKTPVANVPAVATDDAGSYGQNGLLDIAAAPDFASTSAVYLSYVEPGENGSRLVLARARLAATNNRAALEELQVLWRQSPAGSAGQPGGVIAFDPAGQHVFLTVGDRMEPESAQDMSQLRGKVVRLNLDGSAPADNPYAG